jgi:hypothetical protein
MTAVGPAGAPIALERLAEELDRREFATVLVTGPGRRARLTVENRRTKVTEDIYADGWYWWSWTERIAPTDDPVTAAQQVTARLRGSLSPSSGIGPPVMF